MQFQKITNVKLNQSGTREMKLLNFVVSLLLALTMAQQIMARIALLERVGPETIEALEDKLLDVDVLDQNLADVELGAVGEQLGQLGI